MNGLTALYISVAQFSLYISVELSRMSRENNLFCPNSTAGSAEPAFGSHLAYHTDPQRNQNDTVTQECLQKNRSTTPQIVDLSSLKSTKTPMIVTLIQHIIFPIFKFVQDLLVAQSDNACAASAVDYYDPLWSPSTIPYRSLCSDISCPQQTLP